MSQDLIGKWYVYRHNVSRHVLKATVTELEIEPPQPPDEEEFTCLANFELSGFDYPVPVLMDRAEPGNTGDQEATTVTWFGEKESFDFRWDRHDDLPDALVGYAADRLHPGSRDAFVAVKSQSTGPLNMPDPYHFQYTYVTPLARTRPSTKKNTGVSIFRNGMSITFGGTHYDILEDEPLPQGRRFSAETPDHLQQLRLWVLPVDGSERLFAIGYHFDYHVIGGPTVPEHPMCGFTVHLR